MSDIMAAYKKQPEKKVTNRITQEFQAFGLHIAEQLNDAAHKGIYIRMAKQQPRGLLQSALSFVSDSGARNKGALFMWKVKQLRGAKK
jgi:hypothetical protein